MTYMRDRDRKYELFFGFLNWLIYNKTGIISLKKLAFIFSRFRQCQIVAIQFSTTFVSAELFANFRIHQKIERQLNQHGMMFDT